MIGQKLFLRVSLTLGFIPEKKYPNGWEEFVWDDVEFCHRAKDNNYDIWVDPNIIVRKQSCCSFINIKR